MCRFCDALDVNKLCYKIARKCDKDQELKLYGPWKAEYRTAIVIRSWYEKKGKKSASRTVDYGGNGIGFALNYCPECGRELKKTNVSSKRKENENEN